MKKYEVKVIVKRIVVTADTKDSLVKGEWSFIKYAVDSKEAIEKALDDFHDQIPIAVLDDYQFNITTRTNE